MTLIPDEGIELAKSMLTSRGYSLYSQIWNDQPPMLTYVVSTTIRLFGNDTVIIRIICVLINSLIVVFLARSLLLVCSAESVAIAIMLLLISSDYTILEISVLRGLPSISFCMISLYMLISFFQKPNKIHLLVASALFISISLSFKLITVFLVPCFLILIFIKIKKLRTGVQQGIIWLSIISSLIIGMFVTSGMVTELDQLVHHFDNDVRSKYSLLTNLKRVSSFYLSNWHLLPFILVNIYYWNNSKTKLVFALIICTTIVLLIHHPIQKHYITLIAVPMVALAAEGIDQLLNKTRFNNTLIASAVILILFSVHMINQNSFFQSKRVIELKLVQEIKQNNDQSTPFFTDLPRYAFEAGLEVYPEIAVISGKRFKSGNLTSIKMNDLLLRYAPNHILIRRFRDKKRGFYYGEFNNSLSKKFNKTSFRGYLIKNKTPY